MKVCVYHLKHNRAMYSLMFGSFIEGLKSYDQRFQVVQSRAKSFKPQLAHGLSVVFTNVDSRVGDILKKQKQESKKYLTLYIGAFHRNGIVDIKNRNEIYGWDTGSKPQKDALIYCDLLSSDYMQHEFIGESTDRIEALNHFNLNIDPWKTNGKYILIPEQIHPEGMGHGVTDWVSWAKDICSKIRYVTDMPIKIRRHPNRFAWKDFKKDISKYFDNVEFTDGTSLDQDLNDAYALVTLSSRCVVQAVTKGVHCYTEDLNSLAYSVCNKSLDFLLSPEKFDREKWLAKAAYSHWSLEEIMSGDYYKHLSEAIF